MFHKLAAWLRSLFGGQAAQNNDPPMTPVTTVYYFPVDHQGNEVGAPMQIGLNADGSADLSKLPPDLRAKLEHGVPNELRMGIILPKDGERFLRALLETANGYMRFRTTNTPNV